MTDVEYLIYRILNANWDEENALKPKEIIYDDSVEQRTLERPHSIKIYTVDGTFKPNTLGHGSEQPVYRVTVDLQGQGRSLVLAQVDEIRRALNEDRVNPGALLDPPDLTFDVMNVTQARKQAGYWHFYHYTIDLFLQRTDKRLDE